MLTVRIYTNYWELEDLRKRVRIQQGIISQLKQNTQNRQQVMDILTMVVEQQQQHHQGLLQHPFQGINSDLNLVYQVSMSFMFHLIPFMLHLIHLIFYNFCSYNFIYIYIYICFRLRSLKMMLLCPWQTLWMPFVMQ